MLSACGFAHFHVPRPARHRGHRLCSPRCCVLGARPLVARALAHFHFWVLLPWGTSSIKRMVVEAMKVNRQER